MKTHIRFALPLAAAILLAACSASPEDQLERAEAAFAAEDYNAARIDLMAALGTQPENPEMLLLLARSQVRLGDAEGALATLGKLERLKAGGLPARRVHAEAELLRGKPREAYALLASDKTADAWRLRAAALIDMGNPTNALVALRRGEAAGTDTRLISDLAWFLYSANDFDGAKAQLAVLEKQVPGGFQGYLLKGRLALRTGHYAEALALFEEASEKFPTRMEPLLGKAEALEALNRLDEAQAAAARAEVLAPGNPRAHSMVLRIASVQGNWQRVREILQGNEGGIDPLSADGLLYAEAMMNLGFAEQARVLLARTSLLDPGNSYARRLLGQAQLQSGDAAGAAKTLAPLAADVMAGPEEIGLLAKATGQAGLPEAARYQAMLAEPQLARKAQLIRDGDDAMQKQDWGRAIKAFSGLLEFDATAYALNNLAYAQSRAGQHAAAIVTADRALSLDPGSPSVLKTAAMARIGAGTDIPRAQALLRQALLATPMDLELVVLAEKAARN